MDLDALLRCVSGASCIVTQLTSGMIIGMLLFLIASGVTLIFGVLNITNFAHGSLYMAGAYIALSIYRLTGNYFVAVVGASIAVGILGILFERLLMSRVYGSNVLMQLLVCYAVILIADDTAKIIWGPSALSMGMPPDMKGVFEVIDEIARRGKAAGRHISHTMRLTDDVIERMGDYMKIGSRLFTVSPLDFLRQGGVKLMKDAHDIEKRVLAQSSK